VRSKLIALFVLPSVTVAVPFAALKVVDSRAQRSAGEALEWAEHAVVMTKLDAATADFVDQSAACTTPSGANRCPRAELARRKLDELRVESLSLSSRFGDEEAAEEKELSDAILTLMAATDEGDRRQLYEREVSPKIDRRVRQELSGSRGSLEAAGLARRRAFLASAAGMSVSALIALGLAWSILRRLTAAVRSLTDGANAVARGDWGAKLAVDSGDELNIVARAFEDMAAELQQTTVLRSDLEALVVDRTRALEQSLVELRSAQAKLLVTERMAAVGTLVSGVAHEINNPLSYVVSNLEFVKASFAAGSSEPHAETSQALAEALEGAERVRAVVQDLRVFGRSPEKAGSSLGIDALLDSVCSMARPQVRHSATIRKDYRSRRQLVGDSGRHAQVFLNLVVNAAQAMPKRALAENVITVTTRDEGPSVVIEIADNGVGIPPGDLPHVFDPFFTTKSAGEGMGLGLAISKSIVESQGGTLGVESAPQRGSLFRVVLPAAHSASESASEAPAPTRARARVVVVDDEKPLGSAIRRLLPEHEVLTYTDPFEAEAGALNDADVVLCDVMMQGMTGPELLERIRARDPEQADRVVLITGGAITEAIAGDVAACGASVLGKPFGARELRAAVARVLDASGRKHAA